MEKKLTEIQKLSLEFMNELAEILDRHNIRYSLYAGTLLGAIRDGGFCYGNDGSMDDDIDICIDFMDYEKLRYLYESHCLGNFELSGFKIFNPKYIVKEEYKPGKYMPEKPLFIDIFYYIPTSKEMKESSVPVGLARNLCNVNSLMVNKYTNGCSLVLMNQHLRYLLKQTPHEAYVSSASFDRLPEWGCPKFGNEFVNFEGYNFRVMDNYEDYLNAVYGDWHKRLDHCHGHGLILVGENYDMTEQ